MTVPALTTLSEEETLLRDAVLGFAETRIDSSIASVGRVRVSLLRSIMAGLGGRIGL